jgi:hypothetical protein
VYEVVRALHENETVEDVSEHVERLVTYLKREETEETRRDGSHDAETGARLEEVEDDEDEMIVEV